MWLFDVLSREVSHLLEKWGEKNALKQDMDLPKWQRQMDLWFTGVCMSELVCIFFAKSAAEMCRLTELCAQ